MSEVLDGMELLESRMNDIATKADKFIEKAGRLETMHVRELMTTVEALEDKATRAGSFERGDCSMGSVARTEERMEGLENTQLAIIKMVSDLSDDLKEALGVVRIEVADLSAILNLTTRVVGDQTPSEGIAWFNKIKVSESKPFYEVRDAKILEKFIFDLEQYFWATNTMAEEAKVMLVTMHLANDVKLWWRSKYMDIQDGRCTVDTWDSLKQELRSQFLPGNVEIIARRKLRELNHTGNIQDYVRQFSWLMLDIRDMSEIDKIFNFIKGLKPWVKNKLYEQRVQTLSTAYVIVEQFFDLDSDEPQEMWGGGGD